MMKGVYVQALANLRAPRLRLYATFMFGYDEDMAASFERGLSFAEEHRFYIAAFNHLTHFPGTPLYRRLADEGGACDSTTGGSTSATPTTWCRSRRRRSACAASSDARRRFRSSAARVRSPNASAKSCMRRSLQMSSQGCSTATSIRGLRCLHRNELVAGVSYTLFVETDADLPSGISVRLEGALRQNPHYALAVHLRQLAPARVVRIRDGFQGFVRGSIVRERRLGDVKPVALDREGGRFDVSTSVAPCTTQ